MEGESPPRVLVVEDDLVTARMILTRFRMKDIPSDIALDAEEALEKLNKGSYRVVLLDLLMPKRDGFWLLEKIRGDEALKGLKVVVFSNLGLEEAQEKSENIRKGLIIVDYLVKTETSVDEIVEKIFSLLKT